MTGASARPGCARSPADTELPGVKTGSQGLARCDNIDGMPWGEVELEPEVRDWLEGLDDRRWAQAVFHLDLLEERGFTVVSLDISELQKAEGGLTCSCLLFEDQCES